MYGAPLHVMCTMVPRHCIRRQELQSSVIVPPIAEEFDRVGLLHVPRSHGTMDVAARAITMRTTALKS